MTHVAVLGTLAQLGGAEQSLLEVVRHLGREMRFTVVLPEDGPLATRVCDAGASVELVRWPAALAAFGERTRGHFRFARLARAVVATPGVLRELRRTLTRLAPDVVVTNGIKAHVLGALVRRPADPPLVWYAREGLEDRPYSRTLLGLLSHRCDGAIAISRYVASEFRPLMPLRAPIHVVPNIVDFARFRPGLRSPADLPKAPGEVRFGVVGALTPLKGQDLFLEAAARVVAALPDARFVIVGGSPYRTEATLGFGERLRGQARALGIERHVAFLGARDDVASVMASLDVLVQPNRGPEGLGRSIVEAMATALPVVVVDRWGPRELVRDGETGLLVPHLDVPALAERMVRLGSDPALRTRLGRAARTWVTHAYDPDRLGAGFRAALTEMLGARASRLGAGVKEMALTGR
ncbi:MAG: glycosyltransferase family 4 protein [Candidatus Binatia bacterium]